MSALIHGHRRDGQRILQTVLRVAPTLDEAQAAHYVDLVYSAHPSAVRAAMEVVMTIHGREFKSDFMRKLNAEGREEGREEGRVQGKREALKRGFAARGLPLSEAGLERINQCAAEVLDRWVTRAVNAASEDEVFADD